MLPCNGNKSLRLPLIGAISAQFLEGAMPVHEKRTRKKIRNDPKAGDRSEERNQKGVWENYRGELLRFIQKRVGNETLAEDIVQDVLLKGYSKRHSLKDPGRLRAWLYRISRNAIIDQYRSRRPNLPLPEALINDDSDAGNPVREELARCLTPIIDGLPSHYRTALRRVELEGISQSALASELGLSLSGAKSRLQRARKLLVSAFLDCCRIEQDRRGGVRDYEKRDKCAGC